MSVLAAYWEKRQILKELKDFLQKYHCYGALFLALINIIWFVYMTLSGNINTSEGMLSCGAMLSDALEKGNYSQIFTSFFVHFDIMHLCNNMLLLVVVGAMLERYTGTVIFLIIYMVSGIGGNIVSACWHMHTNQIVLSAGASGAVFGIVGGLLAAIILNKGKIEDMTVQKMLVFAGLSLYQGFVSQGIDNSAHVGGFLCGFVTLTICEVIRKVSGVKYES